MTPISIIGSVWRAVVNEHFTGAVSVDVHQPATAAVASRTRPPGYGYGSAEHITTTTPWWRHYFG